MLFSFTRLEEPSKRARPSSERFEHAFPGGPGNDAFLAQPLQPLFERFLAALDRPQFSDRFSSMRNRYDVAVLHTFQKLTEMRLRLVG